MLYRTAPWNEERLKKRRDILNLEQGNKEHEDHQDHDFLVHQRGNQFLMSTKVYDGRKYNGKKKNNHSMD